MHHRHGTMQPFARSFDRIEEVKGKYTPAGSRSKRQRLLLIWDAPGFSGGAMSPEQQRSDFEERLQQYWREHEVRQCGGAVPCMHGTHPIFAVYS